MASVEQLEKALKNADAAGDEKAARRLAAEIRRKRDDRKGSGRQQQEQPEQQRQSQGDQAQEEEQGFWGNLYEGAKELITGESRQTEQTRSLPEGVQVPFELIGPEGDRFRQPRAALGMMTTFDPEKQAAVLKENYPELSFEEDEKGNIIVDAEAYGGGKGVMNKPGLSPDDLRRVGFQVAAFTPAGRAAGAVAGAGRAAGAGAGGAAATQAGLDLATQAAGSEEEVSLGNIDMGEVGLAAAGGAGGELVARGLARLAPLFRRTEEIDASPEVKRAVQQGLRRVAERQKEAGQQFSDEMVADMLVREGIPDDVAQQIMSGATARQAAQRSRQTAQAQTQEFGIPYTAGQRSGSPERLQLEEALRSGGMGGEQARAAERGFREFQESSIAQAARQQQEAIGGGARRVASTQEAGEVVGGAVADAAERMNQAVREAYDAVPRGAFLNTQGAQQMTKSLRRALVGADVDKSLKSTSKVMDDLGRMDKALKVVEGKKGRVPLQTIEGFRRRLNTYMRSAEDASDKRQVMLVKNALDDYMDTAVADKLFQGAGEEGYEALKRARGMRRQYSELFEPQKAKTKAGVRDTDRAGQLINKMAELDPEADEVVNAIFGAGNLFGKRGGAEVARRVKQIVGPDSDEFQTLREAAFLKMFGVDKGELAEQGIQISGRRALTNLKEAMQGRGKGLANELFSAEELDGMLRLARAVKRAQPERFNPSGTAGQLGFQMRESVNNLLGMAGFAGGPIQGIMTTALQKGLGAVDDKQAVQLARQVFSGKPLTRMTPRVPGTAGGATAAQGARAPTATATQQEPRQSEPERD